MGTHNTNYDVIIAGGGPAGTSAAIHLAQSKLKVLLVEQKIFPRPKLCGEFISPECFRHFEKLGVALEMQASNPTEITETVFYSTQGRKIVVPSYWFGGGQALGLSRWAMDNNLLRRAKASGVDVLEGASVSALLEDDDKGALGVRIKVGAAEREEFGSIVIDATGRTRALGRKAESSPALRPSLVAFKAHLLGTRARPSACEIYSYPDGYGGVSSVEGGRSNLCFIIRAKEVRRARSNPERILRETVMNNQRAAYTLASARVCTEWLSVALESFGRRNPSPTRGLLCIGDSAAFIDPFTGSGMLMALQSGELAAESIVRYRDKLQTKEAIAKLCEEYSQTYRRIFSSRLRICSLLRRVALRPSLAELMLTICGSSDSFRGWLARATRSGGGQKPEGASLT